MARTQISSKQILDHDLGRNDINTTKPGEAMITQIAIGPSLHMDHTGVDPGTGLVTLNINSFTYIQNEPLVTWIITHNLNKYPQVTILDSSEEKQIVYR